MRIGCGGRYALEEMEDDFCSPVQTEKKGLGKKKRREKNNERQFEVHILEWSKAPTTTNIIGRMYF